MTGRVSPFSIPSGQLPEAGLHPPVPGYNPENPHSSHIAFIPEEYRRKGRVVVAGFSLLMYYKIFICFRVAELGS